MRFFYSNASVFFIGFTVMAYSWIFGGIQPKELLGVMPWAAALSLETILFLPQRRPREDIFTARRRCWHGILRDPLAWAAALFLVLISFPFLNRALCVNCEYDKIFALFLDSEWANMTDPVEYAPVFASIAAAPIPYAPFCLNTNEHLTVFMWFFPTLLAAVAAKHALTRSGKRMLVELFVWNAAAIATLGFIQQASGAEGVLWTDIAKGAQFFATFGYPNMAASFFTLALALSIGLWLTRANEARTLWSDWKANKTSQGVGHEPKALWARAHYVLIPASLNFFGALATLSRAGVIFAMSLAALAFVYVVGSIFVPRSDARRKAKDIRRAVYYGLGGLLFLLLVAIFAPREEIAHEFSNTDSMQMADRITHRNEEYASAAWNVFKDHPLWGVGGWGYRHLCVDKLPEDILRSFRTGGGGGNVHNDYLQFLCEHGAVGAAILLAILVFLVWPLIRKWGNLARQLRFIKTRHDLPARPRTLYVLPPGALWTFIGCVCVLVHALGDCPLRSPAVLSMLTISLACIEGFLPHSNT